MPVVPAGFRVGWVGYVVRWFGSLLSKVVDVIPEQTRDEAFAAFVTDAEPRLRRSLCALRGAAVGREAVAEALAWAWEFWDRVVEMENPVGYLYRVGVSRTRDRRHGFPPQHPGPEPSGFEPGLHPALAALTERQRTAVVLVHGCGWSYQEVADALDVSKSSVGTHVARALEQLRAELGVPNHA